MLLRSSTAAGSSPAANRDGSLSRIIAAAEERAGLGESSAGIRARAALQLEGRSPGEGNEWRMLDAGEEKVDVEDVDRDEVVMMDEEFSIDTEFEQQNQEEEDADDLVDLNDGPDDGTCLFAVYFVEYESVPKLSLLSYGGDDDDPDDCKEDLNDGSIPFGDSSMLWH
jgi:hypothetical protein